MFPLVKNISLLKKMRNESFTRKKEPTWPPAKGKDEGWMNQYVSLRMYAIYRAKLLRRHPCHGGGLHFVHPHTPCKVNGGRQQPAKRMNFFSPRNRQRNFFPSINLRLAEDEGRNVYFFKSLIPTGKVDF